MMNPAVQICANEMPIHLSMDERQALVVILRTWQTQTLSEFRQFKTDKIRYFS